MRLNTKATDHNFRQKRHRPASMTMVANSKQFVLGLCALLIGFMEYVLSRPADSTYLGKIIEALAGGFPFKINIFGIFGGVLPEFVHPFSFALITMAMLPQASKKARGMICLFWLVVDLLFEMGQCFGHQIARLMPKILPDGRVLDLLTNFFANGIYDHVDMLAICLGITAAYFIGELTIIKGGTENETQTMDQRKANRLKKANQGPALETGS